MSEHNIQVPPLQVQVLEESVKQIVDASVQAGGFFLR